MIQQYSKTFFRSIKCYNNLLKLQRSEINMKNNNLFIKSGSILQNHLNVYNFSSQKPIDSNQQLKNQSKQFQKYFVENIIELEKSEDWQMVLSNTAEPIVIDFYADWCEPCKKLTPILEERVNKTQGKVKLLKVNIDKCGQLAHTLKITSVPTVYAVFRGQGIDSFQGLPDNAKIDRMFQTLNKVSELASSEDKAYELLGTGKQLLSQGKFGEAEKAFLEVNQKGVDPQLIALKQVLLAQCFFEQQKIAKFKDQIERMKKYEKYYISNPELKDFYELILRQSEKISESSGQNPEITSLKLQIQKNPSDLSLYFGLSQIYKQNEMIEQSLQSLIQIIKINKEWQDKKANKRILEIFKQLGNTSPLTQKYRKIMQRLLY